MRDAASTGAELSHAASLTLGTDKRVSIVTWEGGLKAGETRTYTLSYTVKYPKGMSLNFAQ